MVHLAKPGASKSERKFHNSDCDVNLLYNLFITNTKAKTKYDNSKISQSRLVSVLQNMKGSSQDLLIILG